ncbi:Zinc finger protein 782 [Papilio xuthus]|uniref:Zinc finger protein 782 n=1 Tax=Papilio xuthus TaxID=66420 RepID=A0A0N1PFV9_PAPXU|nr:Zinc finger protein 782 [Papilio xuthus]
MTRNWYSKTLQISLDSPAGEGEGKYVLGKLQMMQGDDDDDDQSTIVMGSENGIIRVMSGQKFLSGEISLVMPEEEDLEEQDTQDSNEDSQFELHVSGDEETANAIIAAAQEQGGAFIKVESGEMYRVESVQSKPEDDVSGEDDAMLFSGSAASMAQHMRSCHGARIHICALCGLILRKKADYLAHLSQYALTTCCTTHKSLATPSVIIIISSLYVFTEGLGAHPNSKSTLAEHMHTHTGSKPHTCSVCVKSFASKYTLQSHLKTHLDRPRPFKCSQCGKSFLTQQNLNQHEKTHSGVKEFICKVCGKAFGALHNLEVHGVVHSGNKPFVCGVCSKGFARRAEVRDHMRIHTGERPFSCEECGARFTQRSNLHSHRRATHLDDKRHVCHLCPKRFKRRRLLDYHVKASHTGERPLQCEVCQASFVYPEHFKKHMRIHSGEKPYSCEVIYSSRSYTHSEC